MKFSLHEIFEDLETIQTDPMHLINFLAMLEKARNIPRDVKARLDLALAIAKDFPDKAKKHLVIALTQIASERRKFLNFTQPATCGIEADGYETQPGAGHDMPSGLISVDEVSPSLNTDNSADIWNKGKNVHRRDFPVGENSKPTGFRGPHNDRGRIRLPVRTMRSFRPPRAVPR